MIFESPFKIARALRRVQLEIIYKYHERSYEYIPLTNREFEVRTVSYRPSFFPLGLMAQARSARAINPSGKNEDP